MCGIAGTLGPGHDPAAAVAMADRMRHRGPDAEGRRSFDECTLAHTRLRIIDLRLAADQPMTGEDRRVWTVFNGEIYNFVELRAELIAHGHHFRSECDTEVLVHGYEQWGEGLLPRLRGMFAFAIWDASARSLLLARDRLGIKPLYYRTDGPALSFASEARALAGTSTPVSSTAVDDFLTLGWVPGYGSVFVGIEELPPGHLLRWRDGCAEVRRWWRLPRAGIGVTSVGELGEVLRDAARRHLVADVPVGLFLSSGLDSLAVAALTAPLATDLTAYTVSFGGPHDESAAAARHAARLGLRHVIVPVDGQDVLRGIDDIIGALDQPSVDGANSWVISGAVRDSGVVVALSGLGGDELFGGYSTFHHVPRMAHLGNRLRPAAPLLRRAAVGVLGASSRTAHSRLRRASEAVLAGGAAASYGAVRGLFTTAERTWLRPGAASRSAGGVVVSDGSVTALEMENYLPFQLLRDTDAMSMAHSLEVRVPLLDDEVVEAAVLADQGLQGLRGKVLLAEAVGPSLRAVATAPKQTFTLPFDRWLRGELAGWSRESVLTLGDLDLGFERTALDALWHRFQRGHVGWRPLWALCVLSRWIGLHGTRRSPTL